MDRNRGKNSTIIHHIKEKLSIVLFSFYSNIMNTYLIIIRATFNNLIKMPDKLPRAYFCLIP